MIGGALFLKRLEEENVHFYTGVPDSLLKGFNTALHALPSTRHVIAANEGAAIGMAAGYHLATGSVPLVYLQNSGLGNIINPLTSLADSEVYGIPMLLAIGWRGQPGHADEPQHQKMGRVTPSLLSALEIPYKILAKDSGATWEASLKEALENCRSQSHPFALLVEDGFFLKEEIGKQNRYELDAKTAIEAVVKAFDRKIKFIATTGKIGRIIYEITRDLYNGDRACFLNVGAMGHTNSLAASIAFHSNEEVVLFDGDGALIMHMGALATIASLRLKKFTYILLNNGVHESVGGQPTVGFDVDFCGIAMACGYTNIHRVEDLSSLDHWLQNNNEEQQFVEIRINALVSSQLGRPAETPLEAKQKFMQRFQKS
ncbi:MAG: ppd [Flaviaesturariibacter sp.]|nr:ppd [Flaviaesturariibacter sp.]